MDTVGTTRRIEQIRKAWSHLHLKSILVGLEAVEYPPATVAGVRVNRFPSVDKAPKGDKGDKAPKGDAAGWVVASVAAGQVSSASAA